MEEESEEIEGGSSSLLLTPPHPSSPLLFTIFCLFFAPSIKKILYLSQFYQAALPSVLYNALLKPSVCEMVF